jgi:hypothetical protein
MKKLFFLGLFISQFALVKAQVNRKTFPLSREFKKSGFSISPLATVSFGNKSNLKEFSNDAGFEWEHAEIGRGTWNAGIELGWFKTFEGYQIGDYFEAALSYRRFSGVHYLEETNFIAPAGLALLSYQYRESQNAWRFETVTAAIRLIDIAFQKPNRFLTWGIGINYDYMIASRFDFDYPQDLLTSNRTPFDNQHAIRAHFQVGYGFKLSKHLFLIPTVETPLITALPTSTLNPSIQFLDVNYQPIIIGLKFMILRRDPVNCNAPQLKTMPSK